MSDYMPDLNKASNLDLLMIASTFIIAAMLIVILAPFAIYATALSWLLA